MDLSLNVELISQKTQSDIQAIATPVQCMLQHGENTKTTLSEIQAQTHQKHEVTLDLCRTIPEQCCLLLKQDRTSSQSLEQTLTTELRQLGTERELLSNAIESFDKKCEGKAEQLAMRMDALVRKYAMPTA